MYVRNSDATELEFCELSRAELDFSEPSRAGGLSEASWAELDVFLNELNMSWFSLINSIKNDVFNYL